MAPPNQPTTPQEPNQPPKRETTPLPIPTVGVGKDQVKYLVCFCSPLLRVGS